MIIEVLVLALVVLAVAGYLVVRLARLLRITWKRKSRKFGPLRVSWAGPRLVSAYLNLWLWKGQLYPRKRRARR